MVASLFAANYISIHAPRVGSDFTGIAVRVRMVISIHAPRVGSDLMVIPPFAFY